MASAYAFLNDPKNRDEAAKILVETGGMSAEVAGQIFAPYLDPDKHVLPRKGELDLAAFNRVVALMAETGVIPNPAPGAERFVDPQYLKAAAVQ
jgi:hypothetical protein